MIAIHHRVDKYSFTGKWIEYCDKNQIRYKLVNCYQNNIIDQLRDCDGLMWNWSLSDPKTQQFAKQLTFSLEKMNKPVFPNSQTCWHYDDKVGQKYLLESVGAPLVKTFVFYDKEEALQWAKNTEYPIVFKTRNGAGARNVRLLKGESEAKKLIIKSFGSGISGYDKWNGFKESVWRFKRDRSGNSILSMGKRLAMLPLPVKYHSVFLPQKNYFYCQEFIPDNDCDYRVVVVGKRAYAFKRMVRKGDFRASGSGKIVSSKDEIPTEIVQEAFSINENLSMQSIAIDFVYSHKLNKYLVVEISYDYSKAYVNCPGYRDSEMNWIEGNFYPEVFIIEDFIESIKREITPHK